MNVCDNIFGSDFASLQTDTKTTDDDCIEKCITSSHSICPKWPQHKKMNLNCTWWSAPLKILRSDSALRLSRGCGHPKVDNLSFFFYQNNSVLCQPNHRKTHQDICFRNPPRGPDGLGAQNWLAAVCCGGFVGHSRYSAVPSNRTADLPSCSQTPRLSFWCFS